jgi:FkbM family methyltransferase
MRLIAAFFGPRHGYFVEVGANDPRERSHTWHLEQAGWSGVLIEPRPELAGLLRANRSAKVYAVACSSPENAGRALSLHVAGPLSSLDRERMAPGAAPERVIMVPAKTLDSVLEDAGCPPEFDFLSIDVEGYELEVPRGFSFKRWRYEINGCARLGRPRLLRRRWEILRKYYVALPFRWLRNLSRRLRKGRGR